MTGKILFHVILHYLILLRSYFSMSLFQDPKTVIRLATGHYDDRQNIHHVDINNQILFLFEEVRRNLESIFDLTLLDGALACDKFHQAKRNFIVHGHSYGYIHSYTDRADKTNVFRFQYRPLTAYGDEHKKSIRINRALGGYSSSAFKKAAHESEKKLCIETEKRYLMLRTRSKSIRQFLRKLEKIKLSISEQTSSKIQPAADLKSQSA